MFALFVFLCMFPIGPDGVDNMEYQCIQAELEGFKKVEECDSRRVTEQLSAMKDHTMIVTEWKAACEVKI